jgi:hypothetical protein
MAEFNATTEEIKYVYLVSHECQMKLFENNDDVGNLLNNKEYEGLYFKTNINYLRNKNLETAFFVGIDFLNDDNDDEIYESMDNNVLCTSTNTVIFLTEIMNKDILPLIIDFYKLFYECPFDEISKPIIGNSLEENLPIEWVNFLRPHKFIINFNSEDIRKSTFNQTMLNFSKAAHFLICDKMNELFGCFMACPEGLSNRDINELKVIFQEFDDKDDLNEKDNFNIEDELEKILNCVEQNENLDSDSDSESDPECEDYHVNFKEINEEKLIENIQEDYHVNFEEVNDNIDEEELIENVQEDAEEVEE